MGVWNERIKTYVAEVEVVRYRRVKLLTGGSVDYADADDPGFGVTVSDAKAGDGVSVLPYNNAGTLQVETIAALDIAEVVYSAADGKISDLPVSAGTYYKIGFAEEAASASGDVIEVRPVFAFVVVTV